MLIALAIRFSYCFGIKNPEPVGQQRQHGEQRPDADHDCFADLRHTFATLQLSNGAHFMQVSKWLGHSSYVLTLSTYADYIREDDTAAPNFARPVAAGTDNVVDLERRKRATQRRCGT
jgi:integrase